MIVHERAFSFSTILKEMHKISVLKVFNLMRKVGRIFLKDETKMKILSEI